MSTNLADITSDEEAMLLVTRLRQLATLIEAQGHGRPVIILACVGASDEHWQIFRPSEWQAGHDPEYWVYNNGLAVDATGSSIP